MFNLDTLDTAIAVVIVLLILSLVVQSVQQALKKLLKIKSRQIEDSLVDLFEHVLDEKRGAAGSLFTRVLNASPLLRALTGRHPAEGSEKVKALYDDVKKKFEQAGRVSQRGKLMLDSIAKSDLLKVLGSVSPAVLTPHIPGKIQAAIDEFKVLAQTIEGFRPSAFSEHMSPEAKEKVAEMQGALSALVHDVSAYLRGELVPGQEEADDDAAGGGGQAQPPGGAGGAGGQQLVTSATLLRDVTKLNAMRLDDASRLISEALKAVEEQVALKAQEQNGEMAVKALTAGADTLRSIARGMASFDRTVDQLLASLTRAEKWFDTVMQGFEERYTRSMKTWGIAISLVVVVVLNANFFEVYKNISTNATARAGILQMREEVTRRVDAAKAAGNTAAAEAATQSLNLLVPDIKKDVGESASLYTGLGFTPIWQSWDWVKAHPGNSLFGWILMTLLLSVGAPFWEDVLESLFGLKNVLRKGSDTKNVEDKGGQPKP